MPSKIPGLLKFEEDYRDPSTLWLWILDSRGTRLGYIELSRDEVADILLEGDWEPLPGEEGEEE